VPLCNVVSKERKTPGIAVTEHKDSFPHGAVSVNRGRATTRGSQSTFVVQRLEIAPESEEDHAIGSARWSVTGWCPDEIGRSFIRGPVDLHSWVAMIG